MGNFFRHPEFITLNGHPGNSVLVFNDKNSFKTTDNSVILKHWHTIAWNLPKVPEGNYLLKFIISLDGMEIKICVFDLESKNLITSGNIEFTTPYSFKIEF